MVRARSLPMHATVNWRLRNPALVPLARLRNNIESIIASLHTARFPVALPTLCGAIGALRVVRDTEDKRLHGPPDRHVLCSCRRRRPAV
jgi:hypothetical protein